MGSRSRAVPYVRLMRLKHWIKNGLVFLPAIFSGELFGFPTLINACLAFLCFGLISSAVYINNDIRDREADRLHPTKCNRPLANGSASPKAAAVIAITCAALACVITLVLADLSALVLLLCYAILNLAYSLGIKDKPVADIAILAAGFVLRVLFGGAFCGIPVSLWLFLTVTAFAAYFAFGKRLGELKVHGTDSRKSLESYTPGFLSQGSNTFLTLGLVFYSLWSYERVSTMTPFVGADSLLVIAGVPLVMLICMRYSYILCRPASDGDPVSVLFADRWLIALFVVWMICIIAAIYLVPLLPR